MHLDTYPVVVSQNHSRFEFLSEGPNGTIKKVVLYQRVTKEYFNLAFGDWDEQQKTLLDFNRSNNGDRSKVLATVALTVLEFLNNHPDAKVLARGSTSARTRLYQMGITAHWLQISTELHIEGFYNQQWETFSSSKNYDAFSAVLKKSV